MLAVFTTKRVCKIKPIFWNVFFIKGCIKEKCFVENMNYLHIVMPIFKKDTHDEKEKRANKLLKLAVQKGANYCIMERGCPYIDYAEACGLELPYDFNMRLDDSINAYIKMKKSGTVESLFIFDPKYAVRDLTVYKKAAKYFKNIYLYTNKQDLGADLCEEMMEKYGLAVTLCDKTGIEYGCSFIFSGLEEFDTHNISSNIAIFNLENKKVKKDGDKIISGFSYVLPKGAQKNIPADIYQSDFLAYARKYVSEEIINGRRITAVEMDEGISPLIGWRDLTNRNSISIID